MRGVAGSWSRQIHGQNEDGSLWKRKEQEHLQAYPYQSESLQTGYRERIFPGATPAAPPSYPYGPGAAGHVGMGPVGSSPFPGGSGGIPGNAGSGTWPQDIRAIEPGVTSLRRDEVGTVRVALPQNAQPGQRLQVYIPETGPAFVTVPSDAIPGQILDVSYRIPPPPAPPTYHGGGAAAGVGGVREQGAAMRSASVTLPEGCQGGQKLTVQAGPDTVMFNVPPGARPGQRITVRYTPAPPALSRAPSGWDGARREGGDIGGGQHYQHYLIRRPGRPPGALNYNNRNMVGSNRVAPAAMRRPEQPPTPQQLTRRIVLTGRQKHDAVHLAAQYNTSLFIINNHALEAGLIRLEVPRGRAMRRPSPSMPPLQTLVWHLSTQIPPRAMVLVDIANRTMADQVAKTVHYHGRQGQRPCLSWAPVRVYNGSAKVMRTSASGQPLAWRQIRGQWTYCDADTNEVVDEPVRTEMRSVPCLLPLLHDSHQWFEVAGRWVPLEVMVRAPAPFQIFRIAVKIELAHEIALQRQVLRAFCALCVCVCVFVRVCMHIHARFRMQTDRQKRACKCTQRTHTQVRRAEAARAQVRAWEQGNLTSVLQLVEAITRSPHAHGAGGHQGGDQAAVDARRWSASAHDHEVLEQAAAVHAGIRACFFHDGWNAHTGRLEHVDIEWARVYAKLLALRERYQASDDVSSVAGGGSVAERETIDEVAGQQGAGSISEGAGKPAEGGMTPVAIRSAAETQTVETEGISERHLVERLLRERWKTLSNESRAMYEEANWRLEQEFQAVLEVRKEDERRRRQESFSLEINSPSRRTYTSMQSGGVSIAAEVWGSPREVPASRRKMRGSWRAACLYAVLQLNATTPATGVTKKEMIDFIRRAKPEVLGGDDAPFYLGIHMSNLVRDGILASFQPGRDTRASPVAADAAAEEQREEAYGFGKGRREHMYYAVEGAAQRLDMSDVWPVVRHDKARRRVGRPTFHGQGGRSAQDRLERGVDQRGARSGGKGFGAGEGGVTIRQGQAVMLRRVEVSRGKRAEFVLSRWAEFAPFFEAGDRDLTNGPLARRLVQLSHLARMADGGAGGEMARPAQLPVHGQPACVKNGEMRPYQVEGLKWLVKQHDSGAGGILGDEMGLGKTLQVLSFLGFLKTVRGEGGPHLVVAPLSVMNSWLKESAKWCPELRVMTFHGSVHERDRLRHEVLHKGSYDLCLTTYEMLVADLHGFTHRSVWNYVVLDESHRVKNEQTQLGHAVRRLRCSNRLLITGTPLQNNMHELWSLLNILFPEALSSSSRFDAGFRIEALYANTSDTRNVMDAGLMECAHSLLRPLMLRRMKRDVLSLELPPKTEHKIMVPLSNMQRFLYAGILKNDLSVLAGARSTAQGQKIGQGKINWSKINSLIMQLRKVCNHPYQFPDMDPMETDERIVQASSKLQVLDKLLAKLQREGRKALIYSQFTSMLDIIGDFLRLRDYKHLRLDGSTPAARRRYEIACFENPRSPYFVYLISTRAGGLGITLVAADTVILYDSDWNPAADLQAMDRVHRIGQKKPVHCYRLCTQGTVEERILAAAHHKTVMNALVMQDDGSREYSADGNKLSQRDVSLKDLVGALRDGVKCVAKQDSQEDHADWEARSIEDILAAAETKELSGGCVGNATASGDSAVDGGAQGVDARESEGAKRGEVDEGTGHIEEETGLEVGNEEEEGLSDLFQALPEIRRFEGNVYQKQRETVQDLAEQWLTRYCNKRNLHGVVCNDMSLYRRLFVSHFVSVCFVVCPLTSEDCSGKRQVKQRVVNVDGHSVLAETIATKSRHSGGAGTGPGANARVKTKQSMKHRRSCQRCKRAVGELLFCSKCPVVMHKFCVKSEGWGDFDDSSDESAVEGFAGAADRAGVEVGDDGAENYEEDESEDDEEDEEDADASFTFTGKTDGGTRDGMRPRRARTLVKLEQVSGDGDAKQGQGGNGQCGVERDTQTQPEEGLRQSAEEKQEGNGGDAGVRPTPSSGAPRSEVSTPTSLHSFAQAGTRSGLGLGIDHFDANGASIAAAAASSSNTWVGGWGHSEMKERTARDPDWRLCGKILDAIVLKRDGQHFLGPALDRCLRVFFRPSVLAFCSACLPCVFECTQFILVHADETCIDANIQDCPWMSMQTIRQW